MVTKIDVEPDALICVHCEKGNAAIHEIVYTSKDKLFQFLCGNSDHFNEDDADPIHSKHVFEIHPELAFFAYIQTDFLAQKTLDPDGWRIGYVNVDEMPEVYSLV